ncbi:DUF5132 domain-containing protein [Streptomyces sp. CB03911]|uniref:DUF5132 domain-containing protein n=1 Tax=Streptomycetaceae TaxID=2062 RepID=UPI00094042D5|nr:DUF5132 domain-containing protein [Streptomyces sp. CB03911]
MPPVVPPFLIGLVVAPLARRLIKPLVRGVVKTSVGLVLEVKKAAHEAGENIQDLATEVAADMMAAQIVAGDTGAHSGDGHRVAAGREAPNGEKGAPSGEKGEATGRTESEARASKIRATAGAAAGRSH